MRRLPRHFLAAAPRSRTGKRLHAALDRQADVALDRDRDGSRPPTATELEGWRMTYERKPRVLLMEIEQRVSERTGRPWHSAWLGRAKVVGFEAEEPDARRHRVIRLFVEEPDLRPGT
jgi:hypothetical protein